MLCQVAGYRRREVAQMLGMPIGTVTWKNNADLSSLKGKVIRAKFYLTNGDLYAFWISPWQSGESRGYTAGGGPGLNACGVDRP